MRAWMTDAMLIKYCSITKSPVYNLTVYRMHTATNAELETALQDFKQLLPRNSIPNKMQTKLLLLESAIMGTPREEGLLQELPEF